MKAWLWVLVFMLIVHPVSAYRFGIAPGQIQIYDKTQTRDTNDPVSTEVRVTILEISGDKIQVEIVDGIRNLPQTVSYFPLEVFSRNGTRYIPMYGDWQCPSPFTFPFIYPTDAIDADCLKLAEISGRNYFADLFDLDDEQIEKDRAIEVKTQVGLDVFYAAASQINGVEPTIEDLQKLSPYSVNISLSSYLGIRKGKTVGWLSNFTITYKHEWNLNAINWSSNEMDPLMVLENPSYGILFDSATGWLLEQFIEIENPFTIGYVRDHINLRNHDSELFTIPEWEDEKQDPLPAFIVAGISIIAVTAILARKRRKNQAEPVLYPKKSQPHSKDEP